MKPVPAQSLPRYRAGRDKLLARAQSVVAQDVRVCAAWLFGSLGRGDADDLSDIDLFVIIQDEHFAALVADRAAYMGLLAEPVLTLEAPQNWPPGGVYNMALYPGEWGPYQVDWYWVRRSAAQIPAETVLWFDRVGLPRLTTPTHFTYAPVPERPAVEIATQTVNMFWAMLLITAKYLVRAPEHVPALLASVAASYQQVTTFTQASLLLPPVPAAASALATVDLLRQWVGIMQQTMPAVAAKGGNVPDRFPTHAYRYLDLIQAVIEGLA